MVLVKASYSITNTKNYHKRGTTFTSDLDSGNDRNKKFCSTVTRHGVQSQEPQVLFPGPPFISCMFLGKLQNLCASISILKGSYYGARAWLG